MGHPFPVASLSRYDGLSWGPGKAMRRSSGAARGPNKPRSGTAMPRKRGNAPKKVARVSSPTRTEVEGPAKTEAAQLALELQEARERQGGTAEGPSLIPPPPTGLLPGF